MRILDWSDKNTPCAHILANGVELILVKLLDTETGRFHALRPSKFTMYCFYEDGLCVYAGKIPDAERITIIWNELSIAGRRYKDEEWT